MDIQYLFDALLENEEIITPFYDETIRSKNEIYARYMDFPLVVIWNSPSIDTTQMTASLNEYRLRHVIKEITQNLYSSNEIDILVDDISNMLLHYTDTFLSKLIESGVPVPICFSKECRSSFVFKSKKEEDITILSENEKSIVQKLLIHIFNDEELSTPVYCGNVRSEQDANNISSKLPLVYIWNEDRNRGTFTITINGLIIALLLEAIIPREHPSFGRIRNEVMSVMDQLSRESVIETCKKTNAFPSELF